MVRARSTLTQQGVGGFVSSGAGVRDFEIARVTAGVRQSIQLSSFLFVAAMDPVIRALRRAARAGSCTRMMADDVWMMARKIVWGRLSPTEVRGLAPLVRRGERGHRHAVETIEAQARRARVRERPGAEAVQKRVARSGAGMASLRVRLRSSWARLPSRSRGAERWARLALSAWISFWRSCAPGTEEGRGPSSIYGQRLTACISGKRWGVCSGAVWSPKWMRSHNTWSAITSAGFCMRFAATRMKRCRRFGILASAREPGWAGRSALLECTG